MEKTGSKLEEVLKPVNAIHHHFEEIEKIIDNSTYNNIVNNNQPSVNIGDIHIHCPGITSDEAAIIAGEKFKEIVWGMPINAYQQVMKTR